MIPHGHYGAVADGARPIAVAAARDALGLPANGLVVLLFGVLRPDKGVNDLLIALPGGGGTVRGIVRDALGHAVPFATIAGGPTLTQTDASGAFEILGLPLGTFTIYGQAAGSPALGKVEVTTTGPHDLQEIGVTLEPVGS
ncbi:hypothetical protein B4Q13_22960, partial [Lacticaseibacillus rhamnosus]